ncbi:flagellar motor protein MotB [Paenirhodobacter populi]|uniref:flagellar motor protein MotB n=1 Tax=Paenirhodobacter populi TaxID=2306993 RepID=UPI000FE33BBA|nr:flagellar motor protein MotB [Sinirhodobacter populi]RWR08042.1 chemotaxis protein MotB [Sinirhodobacter populi]
MGKGDTNAPIIIRRKTVVQGGGHHGGAWKVAYADFVTAMMAFFLLMWLLNATTEKQRKGIADYFSPTLPVNRISGGGDGAFGGDSVLSQNQAAESGTGAIFPIPLKQPGDHAMDSDTAREGEDELRQVAEEIERTLAGRSGELMASDRIARRVVTRVTDEGLIVEFFDLENEPLFAPDTANPEPILDEIAGMLTRVFSLVGNQVAVNGYVRAYPEVLRVNPTWDLSAARAQVLRERLEAAGFDRKRIQRVTGYADRKPAVPAVPMSVRNNRIEAILLRKGR